MNDVEAQVLRNITGDLLSSSEELGDPRFDEDRAGNDRFAVISKYLWRNSGRRCWWKKSW